jgi:hypothetical protein
MFSTPAVLRIMKYCALPGLLALAVSACGSLQPGSAASSVTQVSPERVQVVSDALQARLQLMVVQVHPAQGL